MKERLLILCLALVGIAGTTAIAQQAFVPPPTGVRFLELYLPEGKKGPTRIIGNVIDLAMTPVKNARLQLRNLATGNVDQSGESDENGDYSFEVASPSTYIVEMVMADGYVVALSNAGSVGRAETLRTVVQLPGRWDAISQRVQLSQPVSTYFGASAQVSMTTQTLEMAVEQNIAPTGPYTPVSP